MGPGQHDPRYRRDPALGRFDRGIPLGVTAAGLGFPGKQQVDQGVAANRDQAIAGLACGAVGAVPGKVFVVSTVTNLVVPALEG